MATGFIQLNENDTKELRKEIGLPVTKGVIYWSKEVSGVWKKYNVVDYKIVASYEPSGSKSILITLEMKVRFAFCRTIWWICRKHLFLMI